ncbi:MAG: zinc-ribbon and DUF3426 domain-containing protein [Pseudomonadota bacterium]
MNAEKDLVAKCPQCGSVFRLSPQHLQAAKGWVQCGMCGNVFHSGIHPAEAAAAPAPTAPSPAATRTPSSPQPAQAPATQSAQTPAAAEPAQAASVAPEAGAQAAAAGLSGLAQRMSETEAEAQDVPSIFGPKLQSIILVDPNSPNADDDYGPMPTFGAKAEAPKPEAPASPAYTPPAPAQSGSGGRKTATDTGWIPRRPPPRAPVQTEKKRGKLGLLWLLIILALLLALGAQLAYYLRDKLAASHPALRPHLAQACAVLGCSLSLPRDTRQVRVLGSNLRAEEGGTLDLELTLANHAAYPMAWPVLELTLTDVEDQPLARRMFAPSEYLPSNMESKGIQARSEVPLNLQLQSRGIKAAGYRIRTFY